MGAADRRFGPPEFEALDNALQIAREMTGHYYALPDDWFDRTSHEVCTAKDLRGPELLGEGRLALIRRLHRVLEETPGRILACDRLCPHYRICLQDHNILTRLHCAGGLAARDFLAYLLTHEYVHLVRFHRLECAYRAQQDRVVEEESRVEEITRAIAGRFGPPELRRTVRCGLGL